MATTLGWILWLIGIVTIWIGIYMTCSPEDKKVVNGWLLMTIGLFFNGLACIPDNKPTMLVISILAACWDFNIYTKKKKEYKLKKLNSKEEFIKKISNYKK